MLLVVGAFCAFMLLLGISEPIFYVRYFLVVLPVLFVGLGIVTAAAFPLTRTWLVILPLAFFSWAAVTQFRAVDAIQRQNRGVRVRAGRHVVHPEVDEFPRGARGRHDGEVHQTLGRRHHRLGQSRNVRRVETAASGEAGRR